MNRRIGELLVDAGAVSEVDLRQALLQQKKQGGKPRLGELLLSLKKVTPAALARALADQCKLTFVELPAEIPQAVSRKLTVEFQKKHNVLPFRKDVVSGVDQVHVAVADPTQKDLLEQIEGKFREVLRFYVATPADVEAGIERASRAPVAPPPAAAPPAPVAAAPPPAAVAPAPVGDPLDDLLGGGGVTAAGPGAADPLDDLLGGPGVSAPPGGVDPLDDLFGGAGPAPAASAGDALDDLLGAGLSAPAAPAAAPPDPLDDLLGGAPAAPAAPAAAAPDAMDDLLGGAPSEPAAAPPSAAQVDPLTDLFGDGPTAPTDTGSGDPLDDLFGGAPSAPAPSGGGDPLDDLLGGGDSTPPAETPPTGPQTPLAYVHLFPPKPKPVVVVPPEPPPATDGPTENEVTPPSGTAFDELAPEAALPAEPSLSEEDAWLLQELNRLAAGDAAQADALGTVASVVRMLVRKGVIQQEALLGELGR